MNEIQFHPLADLFPLLPDNEQNDLADDIKLHGLLLPIILFEGKILDGRHRYRACMEVDTEPRFEEFSGANPVAFVWSINGNRRHLTVSQRAMIAAKMEGMPVGRPKSTKSSAPTHLPQINGDLTPNSKPTISDTSNPLKSVNLLPVAVSRAEAAKSAHVSIDTVRKAKKVLMESPQLAEEISKNNSFSTEKALAELAKQKEKANPDPVALDKEGFPIPPKILPLWKHAEEEAKTALQLVTKLRSMIKLAGESGDIAYRELRHAETVSLLTNLFGNFKLVLPHGVCTVCQGKLPDTCTLCRGRGFLSGFAYQMFGSDEVKKIREKIKEASK